MNEASDPRPEILVLSFRLSRGIEATGPNQSLINMARALPEYRFRFIGTAAKGDMPGRWSRIHGVEWLPLEAGPLGRRGLRPGASRGRGGVTTSGAGEKGADAGLGRDPARSTRSNRPASRLPR